MGVHGINKKKFDGGDELIRKAFKIYSDKDLESSMEDFGLNIEMTRCLKIRYIKS